jgi:hypothetical protein
MVDCRLLIFVLSFAGIFIESGGYKVFGIVTIIIIIVSSCLHTTVFDYSFCMGTITPPCLLDLQGQHEKV